MPSRIPPAGSRPTRILPVALLAAALSQVAPPARAASFVVASSGRGTADVTLLGRIEPDDGDRLAQVLSTAADHGLVVTRLHLESPGGSAQGGVRIALIVRENGIATDVPGSRICASACFVAFAAGRHRTAGPRAALGVHRSMEDGAESLVSARADRSLADVLRSFGVPERVVAKSLSTPSDHVYVLTRSDLAAMGVRTTRPR